MEFIQKRMATNIRFEFTEVELKYWIRDNSGERDLNIDYSQAPGATRRVFERNNWLRNVGALWCLLGTVTMGLAAVGSRPLAGASFWLLLGVACLIFYRLTQTNYTVLDTDNGTIWIMEDKQFASILSELQSRRKARLLDIYGAFNPNNDHDREIQKYDWLVKEQVLSREEADRRIAQRGGQADLISSPGRLLN